MNEYQTTLDMLGDTRRKMSRRELRGLSDIGRESEDEFLAIWRAIDLARRREIVRAMVDVAEDNVEFDFRDAFAACLHDADAEVRLVAVEGLAEDDRPRTMRRLLAMLDGEPDDAVRAAVALALGRFAYQAALDELGVDDTARLRAALVHAARNLDLHADVRRRALEGAGYFAGADVDEAIAGAYASGDDQLKASALVAIGHSLDRRWAPVLEAELRSTAPALRYEAARASGELAEEAASLVPLLLPLATEDDAEIYHAAIWALGQIGGTEARRALQRLVQADDPVRRAAAQEALGELELNEDPFRLI